MNWNDLKRKRLIGMRLQRRTFEWLKNFGFCMLLCQLIMNMIPAEAAATDPPATLNCDVHNGPCVQIFSDMEVILDINPKPVKAMTDLKFTLTLKGKHPEASPYIDLGMPGMKMGPNRIFLQSIGKGAYEGNGIIVRCPSGKRVWKAKITLPDIREVEFVFDVIY